MNIEFNNLDGMYPFKFYDIGLHWVQHKVYRPNGFEYYHWLQTDEGKGFIEIGDKTFSLKKNQGFIIRPNIPYSCYPDSDNKWVTSFFTFEGTATEAVCSFIGLNNYQFYFNMTLELQNFISENYSIFSKNDYSSSLVQSFLVYKFLMLLKKNAYESKIYYTNSHVVNNINEYVRIHYREKITNNDLSLLTGYSIPHMIRLYKEEVGETPMEYIIKYRLRMAKTLINFRSDLTVKQVSEKTGYSNFSHFINQYKKMFNETPGQEKMQTKKDKTTI